MATPQAKRMSLEDFSSSSISVDELATRHPSCACESASSEAGSPGPVDDNEIVRLFLTSRSDIDASKKSHLKRRKFTPTILQKAYTVGLSTCRLSFASREEIEYSAKIIYDGKIRQDPDYGGILAVIDFPVSAVRICSESFFPLCVLETPLERIQGNKFKRPSHSDVVNSKPFDNDEDRLAARRTFYNQILEKAAPKNVEDVTDCNLEQFLPVVARK